MTTITTAFRAPNTSETQNTHFQDIMRPGVYVGFVPKINTADGRLIDLYPENGKSILLTKTGHRVSETDILRAAVRIGAPVPVLYRTDLIVAEISTGFDRITYSVIPGVPASTASTALVPSVLNDRQVPIAKVRVLPSNLGTLSQSNVVPYPKASFLPKQDTHDLKPYIWPLDAKYLVIYPGTYKGQDGLPVNYFGGMAPVLTTSGVTNGTTYYGVVGLNSSGEAAFLGSGLTKAEATASGQGIPLAIATGQVTSDTVTFTSIEDIRSFPQVDSETNNSTYITALSNSLFKYLRVIYPQTGAVTSVTNGTIAESSYTITQTTAGSPVYLYTNNLLNGTGVAPLRTLMVQFDVNVSGLIYYYSTTSSQYGFSTRGYTAGEILNITNYANELYLKIEVPNSAFIGTSPQLYSFGIFMNKGAVADPAIPEMAVVNLLSNPTFSHWDINDIFNSRVDASTDSAIFPIDSSYGPSGWQFTKTDILPTGGKVSKVKINGNYGLQVIPVSAGGTDSLVLEQRLPADGLQGTPVSFSLDVTQSSPGNVVIGIASLAVDYDAGTVVVLGTAETTVQQVSGRASVVLSGGVSSAANEVSFYVRYLSTGATVTIFKACAAIGKNYSLPFAAAQTDTSRHSESGTYTVSQRVYEGDLVAGSAQYFSEKLPVGLPEVLILSNQSVNHGNVALTGDRNSIQISATAASSGRLTVSIIWMAALKYIGTVIN